METMKKKYQEPSIEDVRLMINRPLLQLTSSEGSEEITGEGDPD